jgi:hypothetical protein
MVKNLHDRRRRNIPSSLSDICCKEYDHESSINHVVKINDSRPEFQRNCRSLVRLSMLTGACALDELFCRQVNSKIGRLDWEMPEEARCGFLSRVLNVNLQDAATDPILVRKWREMEVPIDSRILKHILHSMPRRSGKDPLHRYPCSAR